MSKPLLTIEEQAIVKKLFDAMAVGGFSVTTGTRTTVDGTSRVWEWWDWDGEPARGNTVESLVEHLEKKRSRQ